MITDVKLFLYIVVTSVKCGKICLRWRATETLRQINWPSRSEHAMSQAQLSRPGRNDLPS
jgi:hypothetical protein